MAAITARSASENLNGLNRRLHPQFLPQEPTPPLPCPTDPDQISAQMLEVFPSPRKVLHPKWFSGTIVGQVPRPGKGISRAREPLAFYSRSRLVTTLLATAYLNRTVKLSGLPGWLMKSHSLHGKKNGKEISVPLANRTGKIGPLREQMRCLQGGDCRFIRHISSCIAKGVPLGDQREQG